MELKRILHYIEFNIQIVLNKPFPFIEQKKYRVLTSFIFSVLIYSFLCIFQPFGLSDIQYYKIIYIFGFFGITLVSLLFCYLLLPLIFKKFFEFDNWTVEKNLIFMLIQFLLVSVLNWFYNSTVGREIVQQHSLFSFLFITISVGIVPLLLVMYFTERLLSERNIKIAAEFTENNENEKNRMDMNKFIIQSKNDSESISLDLNNLLCIKSEENYINVFYLNNGKVKTILLRNSIKNIDDDLKFNKKIVRCHRSFLVNLNNVSKMTGNARELCLHIEKLDFKIPVSRVFPKKILSELITK